MTRFPNLNAALKYRRLRQGDLTEVLRCSEGAISRKLSGRAAFQDRERSRIAEALQFDREWLFKAVVIPREAMREKAMAAATPETARLDSPRVLTGSSLFGDARFDSLPPKFLRIVSRWVSPNIDVFPLPTKLLNQVLHDHEREVYLLACEFMLKVLRKRLKPRADHFCLWIFYPESLIGVEPSPRWSLGEDCLCASDVRGVIHPVKGEA